MLQIFLPVPDISPGSYVLVNRNKIDALNKKYGYDQPMFYDHIPNNWRESVLIGEAALYRVPSKDHQ